MGILAETFAQRGAIIRPTSSFVNLWRVTVRCVTQAPAPTASYSLGSRSFLRWSPSAKMSGRARPSRRDQLNLDERQARHEPYLGGDNVAFADVAEACAARVREFSELRTFGTRILTLDIVPA